MESILQQIKSIKHIQNVGEDTAAVILCYVLIDTLTLLTLPEGKETQSGTDFIAWVDKYLQGHEDQPYKYRGVDVYGNRCALLHGSAGEAGFHDKNPNAKVFFFHDGGKHEVMDERKIIIAQKSYVNDIIHAVSSFVEELKGDNDLQARVAGRLPKVLITLPLKP